MHALSVSKQLRHLDALSAQTKPLNRNDCSSISPQRLAFNGDLWTHLSIGSSMGKSDTMCTNERGALRLKCTTSSLDPPLNELCYRRMTLSREELHGQLQTSINTSMSAQKCSSDKEICHRVLVFEKLRFALTAERRLQLK
ncbi:hypothetical protein Tsp_12371 [Trichinella spiralis]|uniref:hypothetical protein n=1 Tax=Trichinella spiralis TaxID=6334 RepID=UPI0001EFDC36|nr:hypothetical protein Tsp_12371 [Trichinella spiralis]